MSRICLAVALALGFVVPPRAAAKEDARSREVDAAIKQALKYLKSSQNQDGTWAGGWGRGRNPAVTGLAVMAFLAAGHVPGEGPYGAAVERGVRAVLKMQHPSGLIASEAGHEMYHHGICTLMLAEVAGMCQGEPAKDVRKGLEKAVKVVLLAQRKGRYANDPYRGGWRYRVAGMDSDMSVTGWQLLALRAAKNLGCDVPAEAIERAVEYVKRSQSPSGAFCYTPQGGQTVPCTGTGILALEVCGKGLHRSPETVRGGNFLLRSPPRWRRGGHFFYSVYYCSQATFQLGGNYWEVFRPHLHRELLGGQAADGSWPQGDGQGPNYATAMAVLALAVEYRFLPIYQRGEEPTDKK